MVHLSPHKLELALLQPQIAPNVGNVTGIANLSLASGNNIELPVNLPINICGAAVSILGFSNAGCQGGAGVINDSGNTSTSYDFGGF